MLEYNTQRNELIIKAYGRNIQKMIETALQISDFEKRTQTAKAIVRVMSQLNPETKDVNSVNQKQQSVDYWQKLWDHLFIISNYQLEVNSPFSKPTPKTSEKVPIHHSYEKTKIAYRTYGRNMQEIIKKVSAYPEDVRSQLAIPLANQLKKLYLFYNRNSVNDQLIVKQLREMSDGKIILPDDFILDTTRDILKNNNYYQTQKNNLKSVASKNKKKKNKKKKTL